MQILTGDGTKDVLSAIKLATQLNFRPGASKTFILMPCSSCDIGLQRVNLVNFHHLAHGTLTFSLF